MFDDNILDIVSYLYINEKIIFLSLSKKLHKFKDKIYYNDEVSIDNIQNLWYYDNFMNECISHKTCLCILHILCSLYIFL